MYLLQTSLVLLTGIACIRMCLVDGQGNGVRIFGCHKPSRTGYTYVENATDYTSLVQVDMYSQSHKQRPGMYGLNPANQQFIIVIIISMLVQIFIYDIQKSKILLFSVE